MKKIYATLILSILGLDSQASELETTKTLKRKQAVEQGLRLPIQFNGEKLNTYSIEERLRHHKVPGFSIAVINEGKIDWASGYGVISNTDATQVSTDTRFQAASIAKPVTAYAVMRMHQAGNLNIDEDIQKYLADYTLPEGKQDNANPVTFYNLLAHTSGMTSGGYLGYTQDAEIPTDKQTLTGAAPATTKPARVEIKPGTKVQYSGAGYTLTEMALESIHKNAFDHIMVDWALKDLQMRNSSYKQPNFQAATKIRARGHHSDGAMIEGGWRIHPEQAAAGLWSTPRDLASFAIEMSNAYLGDSELLTKAEATKLLTPVFPQKDLSDAFGGQPAMTFIVAGEADSFLFKHGGGNMGYRSFMLMYPHTGDGLVFMANSDAGFSVGMEILRAVSAIYDWPHYKTQTLTRAPVNAAEQSALLGQYKFDSGWQANIIESDKASGIAVKFPNGDVYPLSAITGSNAYVHAETGVEVAFTNTKGDVQLHLYNQLGKRQRTATQ